MPLSLSLASCIDEDLSRKAMDFKPGRLSVVRNGRVYTWDDLANLSMLPIAVADTVAFGDSGNDATFADSACTFVAMGNATPEIKAVADDICPSVKQDGVAVWLEDHLGLV